MGKRLERMKNGLARRLGIGAGCVLLASILGVYGWQAYYYKDKFLKGTSINGIVCGGLTAEQAEEKIKEQVEGYQLRLSFRDGVTADIPGDAIDYQYVSDGSVTRILEKQNPLLWFRGLYKESSFLFEPETSYNKEKLEEQLEGLACMQPENQTAPEDAYVTFEDKEFVIKEEVMGTTLLADVLKDAAAEAVEKGSSFVSADKVNAYVMPKALKDDEAIIRERDQLNDLVCASITYELPDGEEILNGNDLKKWLDVDEDGNYYMDEEKFEKKIKSFVKKLAKRVDTRGKERPFHTTSGLDVTVEGGTYGWKINQKKERSALLENIQKKEVVVRKPKYSSKELYTKNNGIGDTYIEVNLTEQHLYYYVDGVVEVDSPLVSGRMTSERYTPPGIYFLTYKTTDRVLQGAPGPDGQPSYQSFVNYWMPFNGGIGLHDAGWRSSFGGTIYQYSGSHGCINLPYNAAKKIYSLIDEETPIVCVYNNGYTLHG